MVKRTRTFFQRVRWALLVVATASVGLAAAGQAEPNRSASSSTYRIGAGDVLQVTVWKEPEASAPTVAVRPDGKISLPIVREVEAAGLTTTELEQVLTEKYSKFINGAEVSVVPREINSQKVYLVGAVRREGPIRLLTSMTVLQALAEAGGLTDFAKRKDIYVLRTENKKQIRLPFNYKEVIKGQRMEQNILIQTGDLIVVP